MWLDMQRFMLFWKRVFVVDVDGDALHTRHAPQRAACGGQRALRIVPTHGVRQFAMRTDRFLQQSRGRDIGPAAVLQACGHDHAKKESYRKSLCCP